jgi:hypothetical protein
MWPKKSNQVVMRYLQKGTKHVWNQHPMVLVDQDFHFQIFSKPGDFNVAWFELSEKRKQNGDEQLQ